MKKLLAIFACIVALFASSGAYADWSTMTQDQKNAAILNTAASVPAGAWGGQCYTWVHNIVGTASGIPNILDNTWAGETYYWYQNGHVGVYYGDISDAAVKPGMAVQALFKPTSSFPNGVPHTFIIGTKDGSGFTMHDSNWSGDNLVKHHYVTYTGFRSMLNANYTYSIYYIY